MIVSKKISFDAAHYLPNYKGKCKNMHGHHWVVELAVEGKVEEDGMVIDFTLLKSFLSRIEASLDHKLINDTIPNPTAENICLYIEKRSEEWREEVLGDSCKLAWIKVWETEDSYAMVEG